QWLHDNRTEGCTEKAMDGAAANGHLEMVKWLHHNRPEVCVAVFENKTGQFACARGVRSVGCTTDAMDGAAENGSLEVVKWLHQNREEGCTGDALFLAAKVKKEKKK
ncbi:unnamed protein product, partial [Hapterophycus canaliculatus]